MTGRPPTPPCGAGPGKPTVACAVLRDTGRSVPDATRSQPSSRPRCLGLSPALAADGDACKTIRLSDPGWTDITSTNAIASTLLDRARLRARGQDPLGADRLPGDEGRPDRRLPRQLDAGAAALPRRPRRRQGRRGDRAEPRRRQVHPRGPDRSRRPSSASPTSRTSPPMATPSSEKIYGIETGAPANQNLQKMIDADDFGLGDWSAGRIRRAGDAGPGHPRREVRRRHRLPRLGAAPDEHGARAHLPLRRRRLLRPRLRRRQVCTLARTGWAGGLPERGAASSRTSSSPSTWRTR